MRKYRETVKCPKCGSKRFAGIEEIVETFKVKYYAPTAATDNVELLVVTCDRCGYDWSEKCADYDSGEDAK